MGSKKTFLFAVLVVALSLTGCSTSLANVKISHAQNAEEPTTPFEPIPLYYGADTLFLSQNLQKAYENALGKVFESSGKCVGKAQIHINVADKSEKNGWTIPLAFIPFWPIMPVDEAWQVSFESSIFCENTLVSHVQFEEEERIQATFYGRLRTDLISDAMEAVHRKLIHRLSFEIGKNRPADLNSAQDYTLY